MPAKRKASTLVQPPALADIGLKPYRLIESMRARGTTLVTPEFPLGVVHSAGAYLQENTGWCNLAAFANCAFYHQGQWGAGPLLGRKWDQTSPWYLAALSQQPHDL